MTWTAPLLHQTICSILHLWLLLATLDTPRRSVWLGFTRFGQKFVVHFYAVVRIVAYTHVWYSVGFIPSSLASYIDRSRPLNTLGVQRVQIDTAGLRASVDDKLAAAVPSVRKWLSSSLADSPP